VSEEERSQEVPRLKAREKILIQLHEHACETDEGVFPFEITQKGLSEQLGLRRSHVASALQVLVDEGFVTVVKGHVIGADRRLNVYCITPKGLEAAVSARMRVLEAEVSFEEGDSTSIVKVSEIVISRKASLASVMSQLERGGPVRGEVAVVTKVDKRLISTFCPTCKKQIEVDNVFFDEEVGFDCPGCGRPYRIVPAHTPEQTSEVPEKAPVDQGTAAMALLAAILTMAVAFVALPVCLSVVVLVGVSAGLIVWLSLRGRPDKPAKRRTPLRAVAFTLALSPVVMLLWHLTVAPFDAEPTAYVLFAVIALVVLPYGLMHRFASEFRGDYLLSSGCVLILVAAATMFVVDFGPIDVGMALALGITGAVLVVLSTFFPTDKDALVLDGAAAFGVFLFLLTGAVLTWTASDAFDVAGIAGIATLGVVLVGMRFAREIIGDRELSSHVIAASLLGGAVSLVIMGVLLIDGGSIVPGVLEIAAASPFAYLGSRNVFNEHWRPRLLLSALFASAGALAIAAGLIA
jgi:DNA-binding MarR family transcriptional regulator